MASFAERMSALADELQRCTEQRVRDIAQVKADAERVRAHARDFMARTCREHHSRTHDLRQFLDDFRQEHTTAVQTMRQNFHSRFREATEALRELLASTRRARTEHVTKLCGSFRQARDELAADLEQASHFWQGLHGSRVVSHHGPHATGASV